MHRERSQTEYNPMSIVELYDASRRKNSRWGIDGYEVQKVYVDPRRIVEERELAKIKKGKYEIPNNKGMKNTKLVTRRGHYLEDLHKITKGVPDPAKHSQVTEWPDPKKKQDKPTSAPPKRQSYIDEIMVEAKRRPIPGPGKYNPEKTLDEVKKEVDEMKKKKIKPTERPTYLNEYQYLGAVMPGPGQYNPRAEVIKLKMNNKEPKDWIAIHKKKKEQPKFPSIGTYNPQPTYETFDLIKATKVQNRKYWGSTERFRDLKKSKSLQKDPPGPGQYDVLENWKGKKDAKEPQKKSLFDQVTRGISKSIYY